MELKDFITETLQQVFAGVRAAQEADGGENVNALATSATKELGGNLINRGTFGVFTRIDFDVSVSAETSGGGGAKLTVFGVGAEGAAKHTATSANRISFSIPVRLPDGDGTKVEQAKRKTAAQYSRPPRRGIV